jgi:outer membrane protein insertion porin family
MRYLSLLLLVISTNIYSQVIDKIDIVGNNNIDRGTILTYTPFETGDFYNPQTKVLVRNKLLETGFFKDVIITDSDNTLKLEVIENPVIREVKLIMDGTDLIPEEKALENLKQFGIAKGKIYNQNNLVKFIKQIKDVYITGGYANAIVDYDVATSSDNLTTIKINLAENEITRIKTINIIGNNAFTSEEILDLFTIGEPDNILFNYFTKRDNYSKIELDNSIGFMRDFYFNNGYLDFTVQDIKINPVAESLVIDIIIQEGTQYKLGNVSFTGTDENLKDSILLNSGDIFKRKKVVESVQNITDYFANLGYAFIKVDTKTNKHNDIIDLTINIDKNQKVYINRITISGNTRTEDSVLRREIGLLEGGLYHNNELDESINRIKRLGFFKEVDMKVSKVSGSPDRINLHFEVEEDKTGTFSIGISHSNATGVAFNVGVKESNIFGTGNTLHAEASYSKAVKNFEFYFLNPHFNNQGHSISYGLFSKSVDGSELESSDYIVDKTGLTLGYGVPLDEDSHLKFDTRLSKTDITCSTTFASSSYEKSQCEKDLSSEVLTSLTWTNNTLNNFYFPTEGKSSSLRLGVALPILDYSYYKLDGSHRQYYDLGNDLTFKLKANVGLSDGLSGEELPFFERYYGGGASSVRGFAFNSIGSKYPDGGSKGGKLSVLGSVAVISPLKWVKDSEAMRISAFVDVGSIYDEFNDFETADLRSSAGLAFVWVTPIGPLGVYAATPLKKQDGDDTKTFDFTLGTTF